MSENAKQLSPPYPTFGSFTGFLNNLRENGVPSRIDTSVFGKTSGSIKYSVLAALKFLKLIDERNGKPSETLAQLVNASDEERKPIMASIIRNGYPTLFDGEIDLLTATAGQFDEHIRNQYGTKGSTVDKIATFFITAAKMADLEISPHLKARKPAAASPSSRKSNRQRRVDSESKPNPSPAPSPSAAKPLQYQLVDLMSDPNLEDDVRNSIITLIQYLAEREAKKTATQD